MILPAGTLVKSRHWSHQGEMGRVIRYVREGAFTRGHIYEIQWPGGATEHFHEDNFTVMPQVHRNPLESQVYSYIERELYGP